MKRRCGMSGFQKASVASLDRMPWYETMSCLYLIPREEKGTVPIVRLTPGALPGGCGTFPAINYASSCFTVASFLKAGSEVANRRRSVSRAKAGRALIFFNPCVPARSGVVVHEAPRLAASWIVGLALRRGSGLASSLGRLDRNNVCSLWMGSRRATPRRSTTARTVEALLDGFCTDRANKKVLLQ